MSKQYWMGPGNRPEDHQEGYPEAPTETLIEEEKMKNQTFISMHELHDDAKIVYVSESVQDLLGYEPSELLGRSPFDFFPPDSREKARMQHGRGVKMDKAACLTQWNLKTKNGEYIPCECVFTVVFSVVVAATSLLVDQKTFDEKKEHAKDVSEKFEGRQPDKDRQAEMIEDGQAGMIEDRRSEMIRHLSAKFISPSYGQNEPRAALFLNRFTRSLCILYTTEAVTEMLGIHPRDMNGKSFLECIHEADIMRATDVIESAKDNNSIVYLRFRWRDPRGNMDRRLNPRPNGFTNVANGNHLGSSRNGNNLSLSTNGNWSEPNQNGTIGISSSNGNTDNYGNPTESAAATNSSAQNGISHISNGYEDSDEDTDNHCSDDGEDSDDEEGLLREEEVSYEVPHPPSGDTWVECVISCTSDGLVAVLRKSRSAVDSEVPTGSVPVAYAPWATQPIIPKDNAYVIHPEQADFMETIRQVAAFAWHCEPICTEIRQYKRSREFNYGEEEGPLAGYGKSARFYNGESSAGSGLSSSTKPNGNGSERSEIGANKRLKRSN